MLFLSIFPLLVAGAVVPGSSTTTASSQVIRAPFVSPEDFTLKYLPSNGPKTISAAALSNVVDVKDASTSIVSSYASTDSAATPRAVSVTHSCSFQGNFIAYCSSNPLEGRSGSVFSASETASFFTAGFGTKTFLTALATAGSVLKAVDEVKSSTTSSNWPSWTTTFECEFILPPYIKYQTSNPFQPQRRRTDRFGRVELRSILYS
jgi:hypothetical protein